MFTSFSTTADIPETYSIPEFYEAHQTILGLRASRQVESTQALPQRPNNPVPPISPLLPTIQMCGNCNARAAYHTDQGRFTIDKDGFTKQVCFRTPSTFLQGTPNRDYVPYETTTEVRHHPSNVDVTYNVITSTPKEPVTDYEYAYASPTGGASVPSPDLIFDPEPSDLNAYEFALNYEDHTAELNALDNWRDTATNGNDWIVTSTLEQHQSTGTTEYVVNKRNLDSNKDYKPFTYVGSQPFVSKSVFIEGNAGFTSIQLLDLDLTKKYHDKLLNVFLDAKTNQVRIGSIRLVRNFDSTVTAHCVRNNCNRSNTTTISPTPADLEAFTYSVIAHGNNHAAKWLIEREINKERTWYKAHRFGCLLKSCKDSDVTCQHTVPTEQQPNADRLVAFLTEHNTKCSHLTDCSCIELLAQWTLTPKDYALLHSLTVPV